jgi:hypothetical protein
MAFLTVVKQWVEKIWRVELDTRWAGGEDGTANIQAKQLAARTEYLKDFADEVEAARESEDSLLDRIKKTGVEPMKIMAKFDFISDTPVAASTANVDVETGGLMEMDGIVLHVGDLVFLKDQANKKQNGFWQVQTGAWNRYPGYTGNDCFSYKFIFIKAGEANAGLVFFLDKDVYVIGTDDLEFRESLFSPNSLSGKVLLRDQEGKSEEDEKLDIALTTHGDMIEGWSRSLLDIFKVNTIAEVMLEIRRRCNNNGEIDNSKRPDFRGIRIGDYLDLPSLDDGTTVYQWNENYKNLRIVVSGFNHYKQAGDTENTENHILFTFRNCPLTKRMNATATNTGGFAASELRTYLEGVFALGLKQAIGDYLCPVRRLLSTKGDWSWSNDTVFLPTEREVWGYPVWGEVDNDGGAQGQYPIFFFTAYKGKRYNGSRQWYWTATPLASSASNFCYVSGYIRAGHTGASSAGGVAPAFCVR